MRKIIKNLPLVLLFSAIALSPSFSAGTFGVGKVIELRIEDFLIVILGLVWIANFLISGRKKIERPPLFFPILVWLGIAFLSVLTNWFFMNLGFSQGFFYFLKEVEFFVFYFYIFYQVKSIDSAKFIIKFLILLGSLNVGYVVYQLITGNTTGEYGPAAISEGGVFPTGAFFLIIFIFFFNLFLYYFLNLDISKFKKGILGVIMVSPALGVFGSCSRTDLLGLVFAFLLTLFFLFLRKRSFKLVLISILILILLVSFLILGIKSPAKTHMERLLGNRLSPALWFSSYQSGRVDFWMHYLKEFSEYPLFPLLFGVGKGYIGEAHNQYVRNLVETGIIGSFAFLFLIFLVIKKSFKKYSKSQDSFLIGLSAGLLVATLIMLFFSLATEPFIVVKCASVYWSFTAIVMAVLALKSRENIIKNVIPTSAS